MQFQVLSSGSKGNLTFIKTEQTSVLIDAGISAKEINHDSKLKPEFLINFNIRNHYLQGI